MKWKKVFGLETRDASYTDALVNLIQAQSGGIEPDSSALGALEVAAGLWSRGFASAVLTPSGSIAQSVTPSVLAAIGRSLVRKGESLHVLEVGGGGRLRLMIEAGSWDISGGFDSSRVLGLQCRVSQDHLTRCRDPILPRVSFIVDSLGIPRHLGRGYLLLSFASSSTSSLASFPGDKTL